MTKLYAIKDIKLGKYVRFVPDSAANPRPHVLFKLCATPNAALAIERWERMVRMGDDRFEIESRQLGWDEHDAKENKE